MSVWWMESSDDLTLIYNFKYLKWSAGPSSSYTTAVLRVRMPREVYLRAWIVTSFRGIFSIINILERSRSIQRRILSLHKQLRILSFIPFLFVFKNIIFFVIWYVIESALRLSFLNSSLASSFRPCPQRVKPSVQDSSRFLINHTKNNEQIKLNSYGLKWIENLR